MNDDSHVTNSSNLVNNGRTHNNDYNDNDNNNTDTSGSNDSESGSSSSSFLLRIIQPIFQYSKLSTQLPSYLNQPFVFSTNPIFLLDQSMRGYIQLARQQKQMQLLVEFFPLEQVDEYYYYMPQEIEEEITLPPDSYAPIRRKLTVSSPSHPSQSVQESEKMLGTITSNKQQPQQPTAYKKVEHTQFTTPADGSVAEKLPSTFNFKTNKFQGEGVKEERRITRNARSSSNVDSGEVVSSSDNSNQQQQPSPMKSDRFVKSSYSFKSSSEYRIPNIKVNEPKSFSDSKESSTSKKITPDFENKTHSQTDQFPNIAKTISDGSIKRKYDRPSHEVSENKSTMNSTSGLLPSTKDAIRSDNNNKNSNLNSSRIYVVENNTNNPIGDKPIRFGIGQTKKVTMSVDKSLKVSGTFPQSAKDNRPMNNPSFVSLRPSNTNNMDDFEHDGNKKNYALSKSQMSDKSYKPTITINKLEVHVIGDNRNNIQSYPLDSPVEITRSSLYRHNKFSLGDDQINTESLNKSYLWKYKVRL